MRAAGPERLREVSTLARSTGVTARGEGPRGVAQNLLRCFGSSIPLMPNPIGGHPVVLSFYGEKL